MESSEPIDYTQSNNNQFREFPPEIGKLVNLIELRLFHNQVRELPAEMGSLEKLRWLCVQRNLLHSFPKWIGRLSFCYLNENYLTVTEVKSNDGKCYGIGPQKSKEEWRKEFQEARTRCNTDKSGNVAAKLNKREYWRGQESNYSNRALLQHFIEIGIQQNWICEDLRQQLKMEKFLFL